MSNNVSQKALKTIRTKKIKPKPKWEFLLKDYVVWAIFGLSVLIGSLSVSIIIFMVSNSGWDGIAKFSSLKPMLLNIPYFWILILIVFLFLAYYNFKHTKGGYKHNPYLIIIISILISAVLGSVVYGMGGGKKMEEVFYQKLPLYQKIMNHGARILMSPQEGRLAGIIITEYNLNFSLKDFNGKIWIIVLRGESAENQDLIKVGTRVKIIGEQVSKNKFEADYIKSWSDKMSSPKLKKHFLKENN